jgi:hypothetical protein
MKASGALLPNEVKYIFHFLLFNFLVLLLAMFTPLAGNFIGGKLFLLPFISFSVGGFVLVYWVKKLKLKGGVKRTMQLVGYSAGFIFVSVFLHNIFSAIGIYIMGNEDFEEPLFFLLATIVFPILFLFGSIRALRLFRQT